MPGEDIPAFGVRTYNGMAWWSYYFVSKVGHSKETVRVAPAWLVV